MILATGASGQVGSALARMANVIAIDVAELDLAAPGFEIARVEAVLDVHRPTAVINAAAYTGVDRAEQESSLALMINGAAPGILAHACAKRGIRFVHISTDYVFDGTATRPYREDDEPAPLNIYGSTKRAGEVSVLAAGGTVLRTSWVFSAVGTNFVKTILRLATERPELRVVCDQQGCPTHAPDLARMCVEALAVPAGLYHACGENPLSWFGFATAIVEQARSRRQQLAVERIVPIATTDYPTPAKRPLYSVLDTTKLRAAGIKPVPWTTGLAQTLQELLP